MGGHRIETPEQLTPADRDGVLALVATTIPADGSSPISEHVLMHIKHGKDTGGRHVLSWSDDTLVGYAHLERAGPSWIAEATVSDPECAGPMVDAIVERGGPDVQIWGRGEQSLLTSVLPSLGFEPVRVLVQMRRPLDLELPDPVWPSEVTVRSFVVGQDEDAWLAVNNAAFVHHPDQSNWTRDELEQREQEAWFDPAGFFLAESAGELLGFHWTKVHQPGKPGLEPIGEVYVVGVSPAAQGRRLGVALTLQGLHHLRDRGLPAVKLYVESDNTPAVGLYERLGFSKWNADTCFRRETLTN